MGGLSVFACPQRCIWEEIYHIFLQPFSNTLACNILEGFDGFEPAEDDGTGLNVTISKLFWLFIVIILNFTFSCLGALFGLSRFEESSDNCHWRKC